MRAFKSILPTVIGLSLVLIVLTFVSASPTVAMPTIDNNPTTAPTCDITATQDFNHVVFTTTWAGGDESGEYPFIFGDGTNLILTGTTGVLSFPHDYAYAVQGLVTYTAGFTMAVSSGNASCQYIVTIDDRPPEPTGTLNHVQNFNAVTFTLSWHGATYAHPATLNFGDGSYTDFAGISGTSVVTHDYAYVPAEMTVVTATLSVNDIDVASNIVLIDNRTAYINVVTSWPISITLNPGQETTRTIVVQNWGRKPLTFTLTSTPTTWLQYEPMSSTVEWNQEMTVTVNLDAAGLDVGLYTNTLVLDSNANNTSHWPIPVVLNVISPTVTVLNYVYLPLVISPQPQPTCAITTLEQNFNHAVFELTWSGGYPTTTVPLNFGDGSNPPLFLGAGGTVTASHDFPYLVGQVTEYAQTSFVQGPSGDSPMCWNYLTIDDTH